MIKKLIYLPALFAATLSACGPDFIYQEEKSIPAGRWLYRDTLDFRFDIEDTAALYNLYLDFTYADTFAHQNLYLKIHTLFPDGKRVSKPYSFDLFDAQGASNGKCSGHRCNLRGQLQQNAFFNRPGAYAITLEQFMRRDSVAGVQKLGLTVEKTAGKK